MTGILAVDGGQSAIRLRHSSGQRVVEATGVSRLEGDVVGFVAEAIRRAWQASGFEPVERVVMGLTTAPIDEPSLDRLCGLVAAATGAGEVWLADDAVTSHAGALSLGWGANVAAGTGVACLALPAGGTPRILGGHGFLLGDEGGGFWIGREGIRAVLRGDDGRGPSTSLRAAALERYGPLHDLAIRLHGLDRTVDAIARFAPDVVAEARAGDAVAGSIVDVAAQELAGLVRAAATYAAGARHSERPGAADSPAARADQPPVPIALGGRLLEPGGELRRRLDTRLADDRWLAPRSADGSALDGALAIGRSGDPTIYGGLVHAWRAPVTA